jgi:hypothetical protein
MQTGHGFTRQHRRAEQPPNFFVTKQRSGALLLILLV